MPKHHLPPVAKPIRPIDPKSKHYGEGVTDYYKTAVRRLVPGWDGMNMKTIVAKISDIYPMRTLDQIHAMEWDDIYQACMTKTIKAGTQTPTHTSEFTTMNPWPTAKEYSPADLCDEIDCKSDTLNAYARAAKVRTPERGGKNFRYTKDERRLIFRAIINSPAATQKFIDNCARGLRLEP